MLVLPRWPQFRGWRWAPVAPAPWTLASRRYLQNRLPRDYTYQEVYDLTYTTRNNLMYNLLQYQNLYHPKFVNDYLHAKIDLVLRTMDFSATPIRIGILYDDSISGRTQSLYALDSSSGLQVLHGPKSRFLELVVSDPTMGEQYWYKRVKQRNYNKNNLIKYGKVFNVISSSAQQDNYHVPLKFLHKDLKEPFTETESRDFHSLEILEINNWDTDSSLVVECHMYFLVTDRNDCSTITNDPLLYEVFWPLYQITDTEAELPGSDETLQLDLDTTLLKMNLRLCFEALERMMSLHDDQKSMLLEYESVGGHTVPVLSSQVSTTRDDLQEKEETEPVAQDGAVVSADSSAHPSSPEESLVLAAAERQEIVTAIVHLNIFAVLKFINHQSSAHTAVISMVKLVILLLQYAVNLSINELQRQANKKYLNNQIDKTINDYMVECHKLFFQFKTQFLKELRHSINTHNVVLTNHGVARQLERWLRDKFDLQVFADYDEVQTQLGHIVNLRVRPKLVLPAVEYKNDVLVPERLPMLQRLLQRIVWRQTYQTLLPSVVIPFAGWYLADVDSGLSLALGVLGAMVWARNVVVQIETAQLQWARELLEQVRGQFWKIREQLLKQYSIKYKDYEGLNTVKLNVLQRLDTGVKILEQEDRKRVGGGDSPAGEEPEELAGDRQRRVYDMY